MPQMTLKARRPKGSLQSSQHSTMIQSNHSKEISNFILENSVVHSSWLLSILRFSLDKK
jgi:hypothetical protein